MVDVTWARQIVDRVRRSYEADRGASAWTIYPERVRQAIIVNEVIMGIFSTAADNTVRAGDIQDNIRAAIAANAAAEEAANR